MRPHSLLLLAIWILSSAPAAAEITWLRANFNDKVVGEPVGVGGAAAGEPVSYTTMTAVITDGIFPTNSARLENPGGGPPSMTFRMMDDAMVGGALVTIHIRVAFNSTTEFRTLTIAGPDLLTSRFTTLTFDSAGRITWEDPLVSDTTVGAYLTGTPYDIEMRFHFPSDFYEILINNTSVVAANHGIQGLGIHMVRVGMGQFNVPALMLLDRLVVLGDDTTTSAPSPGALSSFVTAAPNPFRASTRISWQAPRDVSILRVFDGAGRLVRTLRAGEDRASTVWDGRNERGRSLAAGVYYLRLDGEFTAATRPIVLYR